VTVTVPSTATFTVAAAGVPAPTYQWMQSVSNGAYTNISGATSASYITAATIVANSGTTYECMVSNASGSVTSNAGILTVNSQAVPTVSIMSPVNNASYTTPANLILTANASEAGGTISKVVYYNGSALLGTVTNSPYRLMLINAPSGTYHLTAKAIDNAGVSTTSTAVAVTVNTKS